MEELAKGKQLSLLDYSLNNGFLRTFIALIPHSLISMGVPFLFWTNRDMLVTALLTTLHFKYYLLILIPIVFGGYVFTSILANSYLVNKYPDWLHLKSIDK